MVIERKLKIKRRFCREEAEERSFGKREENSFCERKEAQGEE